MYGDIQAARQFLADLRESFLHLPGHARANLLGSIRALAQDRDSGISLPKTKSRTITAA